MSWCRVPFAMHLPWEAQEAREPLEAMRPGFGGEEVHGVGRGNDQLGTGTCALASWWMGAHLAVFPQHLEMNICQRERERERDGSVC